MTLAAQRLMADPRIAQAKELLAAAVADQQKRLTGISPPLPELKKSYAELVDHFGELRGAKLWFPYIGSGFGKGPLVELLDGSVKYDFISGIGPHYFGHGHPVTLDSGIDASLSDLIMEGNLQQNVDAVEMCELLTQTSGFDHCFLSSSGTMANENALKIAFQKRFPAKRVLAFDHCFAGRTITISQITDKASFREGLPSSMLVDYVPYYDPKRPVESTQEAVAALKRHLTRYPSEYALMIFELVQGEAGFHYGTKEFFRTLMLILKEHQVAIFDDEIQCFGRLPELYGFKYFGLEDLVDIVSIGKLSQVCATLFKKDFCPRPGLLSQTFISSTSALRGGKAIINELLQKGYFGPKGKIQQIHDHFVKRLEAIAAKHPQLLQGPYGLGTMIAFTPYQGEEKLAKKLVLDLFEAGVIVFVAGQNPTRIRMLPPAGAITLEDIDSVMKILEETLSRPKEGA